MNDLLLNRRDLVKRKLSEFTERIQGLSTEQLERLTDLPDWGDAAQIAFQTMFPQLLLCCFLLDIERRRPIVISANMI